MSNNRVPGLILGPKDEVIEVVPDRVELHGVAEHHEQGQAQAGDGHGDAVGVAVQNVGADVLSQGKVPGDTDGKVGADGNTVGSTDNIVESAAPITRAELIKHGE